MAAETEGVITLGIAQRIGILLIAGRQQVRITGTMDTISPGAADHGSRITVMTVAAINHAGGAVFRPQAGHGRIFTNRDHRVEGRIGRIKTQTLIDFLDLPGNGNHRRKRIVRMTAGNIFHTDYWPLPPPNR